MKPLHSMTQIIGITKVKVRCVQNRLDHIQVSCVVTFLLLVQVNHGSSVGDNMGGDNFENILIGYSANFLGIIYDNQVGTCKQLYDSYDSPYFPTTCSLRYLTRVGH